MAIRADEKNRFFYIETKNSSYQMKADKYGVLKHIWYGGKTDCSMEYLMQSQDVGFSGNIYDAENDRTYSLDTMPLEYSCEGSGDYRIPSASVVHPNGCCVPDLRYEGYKISKGKYSISGLPAVYADEDTAETLEIFLKDAYSDIYVTLKYGVLEDYDVITRCAVFTNKSGESVKLTNASSLCLDIMYGDWEWVRFQGRHTMERIPERVAISHGIQEASSRRGTSSHQQNPALLLCEKGCSETYGNCIGAVLVYSGSFSAKVELSQLNSVRLVMGINPELFCWTLEPGGEFSTPEAILSYSGKGFEALSHNFHRVIREHICRGKYQLAERPVLINNWEATYFDFDEEKILKIARQSAELGVDMLVLDDGWFGKRNDDNSGLGDWFVNTDKLVHGLDGLVEKVKQYGMKFGIWFEPEMISEDSDLYRTHPDWAIKIPDRNPTRSRFQLVLDMSRKEVRDYLYERVSAILKGADISYVKWDMNRSITDWYSAELNGDRMGELPHRYVLGLYELLERLTGDFHNVLFEGCSGGGGRFDAGMMYYHPQIWCSDDTDAFERTKIQYGTSFFYPISTVGSHVSAVPNHQTGRVTPIETRAVTAMAGSFGYELDLNSVSEEDKQAVREQILRFKKYAPLIHGGKYYRLTNPLEQNISAWEYVSDDRSEALVHAVIFRTEPNMIRYRLKLRGFDSSKNYRLDSGEVYSGTALNEGGILLPATWGDYSSAELHFTETEG